jgi:hypothetical protein
METNRGEIKPNQEESIISPDPDETLPEKEVIEDSSEDQLISAEYEHLIQESQPVDAGQEGFIFKLEMNHLPNETKAALAKSGLEDGDAAVKVLKVYSPGKIGKEFASQKRAYEITEKARAGGRTELAKVPKPVDFRKIEISDTTREVLNKQGAALDGKEVEVMMMDFINGEDLQEKFYRWVVKHAPANKQYAVRIDPDTASFEQLYPAVAAILDFNQIPAGHNAEADREIDSRREKVVSFLQKTGFTLNKTVVDQIRNTREVLQNNRLFHNDEHERNFMLDGDQVYLIDFARAADRKPDDEVDFAIDRLLERLTPEYQVNAKHQAESEVQERVRLLSDDPNLSERYKAIYRASEEGPIMLGRVLRSRSEVAASTEPLLEDFLALMLKLVSENRISNEQASDILGHMKSSLRTPVLKRGKVAGFNIRNQFIYNRIDTYKGMFQ